MQRKPTKSDSSYVEDKLGVLKKQIDKAKKYLDEHPWENIENDDKRDKEFRFQKNLTDSLMDWTESYVNLCGIMDVYSQLEAAKNRTRLKSGSEVSGIQLIVKEIAREQGMNRRRRRIKKDDEEDTSDESTE